MCVHVLCFVDVCVCMCVHVCACCVCTYIMLTCVYVHVYLCIYVCTCVYTKIVCLEAAGIMSAWVGGGDTMFAESHQSNTNLLKSKQEAAYVRV